MNKRGQIYLLMAIIFGFVIYTLAVNVNTAKKTDPNKDFILISENYDKEGEKFLNSLIRVQFDENFVKNGFNDFTGKFTSYSKTIDPGFGFIYFYDYSDRENRRLIVGNHLDQGILVWYNEDNKVSVLGCKTLIRAGYSFGELGSATSFDFADIVSSCSDTVTISDTDDDIYDINYIVGNIKYTSSILEGVPEIVILSEERNERERRVYTNHKFKKGESGINDLRSYCALVGSQPFICDCTIRKNENECSINDLCDWDDQIGCVDNG